MLQHRVDRKTLQYLELVSGKSGDAAINAWLEFTGWSEDVKGRRRQTGVETRLNRAWSNARNHFGRSARVA